MNLVGKKVTHTKYGAGKIIGVGENRMQVEFETMTKTFAYPDSFEQHFTLEDEKAEEYIHQLIHAVKGVRKAEREQQKKDGMQREYIRRLRVDTNSQAVFGMDEETLQQAKEAACVFTGEYVSGVNKGKPRIPKNLNMNSACVLTMLSEGDKEEARRIVGMFMVAADFVGSKCNDGMIPMHQDYRIEWEKEEPLLLAECFPEDSTMAKLGKTGMKYVSGMVVKNILEQMLILASEEKKKDITSFYQYFCHLNRL